MMLDKQKMIGMDKIIDLNTLPEAQAASITALGGPVTQYQLAGHDCPRQ